MEWSRLARLPDKSSRTSTSTYNALFSYCSDSAADIVSLFTTSISTTIIAAACLTLKPATSPPNHPPVGSELRRWLSILNQLADWDFIANAFLLAVNYFWNIILLIFTLHSCQEWILKLNFQANIDEKSLNWFYRNENVLIKTMWYMWTATKLTLKSDCLSTILLIISRQSISK